MIRVELRVVRIGDKGYGGEEDGGLWFVVWGLWWEHLMRECE